MVLEVESEQEEPRKKDKIAPETKPETKRPKRAEGPGSIFFYQ